MGEQQDFRARVTFEELKGTVSADNGHLEGLLELLRERHLIADGEQILGFKARTGENWAGREVEPFYVTVYVGTLDAVDLACNGHQPVPGRAIRLRLGVQELFERFKSFEMALEPPDSLLHAYGVIETEATSAE